MKKWQLAGYSIASTGFALILINAFSYIFNGDVKSPVSSIIGIIFVGMGLTIARKLPA
jgi:hypothetical protein